MNTSDSLPLHEKWFVGRDKYLKEFMAFLKGERDYRVLFIHGPGGIGKTWLLHEMMAAARDLEIPDLVVVGDLIDMYSTANHRIDGVQERMVALLRDAFGNQDRIFAKFREKQHELETGIRERFSDETIESMRKKVEQAFLDDCRFLAETKMPVLFFDTFERVQRDLVGSWVMTELAKSLPHFRFVIASREQWKGNSYIHSKRIEGFTKEEAENYFAKRKHMKTLDEEWADVLREKTKGHPLLIELACEWLQADILSDLKKLRKLSDDAFREALIAPLQKMGQGLFGNPDLDAVVHQTILFMAYFNRRFNADLLKRFADRGNVYLRNLSPEEILNKLGKEFFFVKTQPDGYIQLHDEMEALVREYLWPAFDRTGDYRRDLARIACDWYDEQIAQSPDETTTDDLSVEQLVYMLDSDLKKAAQLLGVYEPLRSFRFNYLLVNEIKSDEIKKLTHRRYEFAADFGNRATRVYLYEQAQAYWKIALEAAQQNHNPEQQIEALLGLHNCTHQVDLQQSLAILEDALALCDRCESMRPTVLYEIGFTYRRLEDIQNAIDWYEKAKRAAVKLADREIMPTILNDMGYAYVLFGNYWKAEYFVKQGLDLRQKKLDEFELTDNQEVRQVGAQPRGVNTPSPPMEVGFSFNTLGQIYRFKGDLAAATGAYSKALSMFNQEKAHLWQARALHSRGEAHRRIAEILFSQGRTKAGGGYEKLASDDFQDCLGLCDQYGFDNEKHTAVRRMGRLLHDRALRATDADEKLSRLDQARDHFERGIEIARRVGNTLEELENLTELAFLVDDRLEALKMSQGRLRKKNIEANAKDIERFREGIKRHEQDDPRIYQFPVFEHLLSMEEGAFRFVTGNPGQALDFYLAGFKGLASDPGYGSARYRQHLGHLFKRLRELKNPEEEKRWCEAFITEWEKTEVERGGRSQTLAEIYPGFIERLNLHVDTAFFFQD